METGKDRVKKICDILRKETLEPAKKQAEEILVEARLSAERIIEEARLNAEKLQQDTALEIQRQKAVFQASLSQACKQALNSLKESFEKKLFNPELLKLISSQVQDPRAIGELVQAIVKALDRDGIDADLSVYIPAAVPAKSVNALLSTAILNRLKEKSVLIGPFKGGVEVKLHKENVTIDISDSTLEEIVAAYIRKDFREMFFGKSEPQSKF